MASFAAIGLLSIPPTLALLKWRKQARSDAALLPADADIMRLRGFIQAEVGLLMLVVVVSIWRALVRKLRRSSRWTGYAASRSA